MHIKSQDIAKRWGGFKDERGEMLAKNSSEFSTAASRGRGPNASKCATLKAYILACQKIFGFAFNLTTLCQERELRSF